MSRPRLLDLFCGAGGCSVGYARAGFDVVGVDINPQPNYPYDFIQADAIEWLHGKRHVVRHLFDAIHASPPCQAFSAYQRTGNVGEYPDLIQPVRELLKATGLPYVIENVEGAPLEEPVTICGSMFDPPLDVQRHRLFETNWPLEAPDWPCRHKIWPPDRFPGGSSTRVAARVTERTGRAIANPSRHRVRRVVEVGTWDIPLAVQQEAMGIDWMTLEELSEAIPPAYTEFIGHQLLAHITQEVAA